LVQNRFTDEQASGTSPEIAWSKLYLGLNGKPMVPQSHLMRCIVDGGYFHKIGEKQIHACLNIKDAEIHIRHKQPWKVYEVRIV
jgi:hypothetical protein